MKNCCILILLTLLPTGCFSIPPSAKVTLVIMDEDSGLLLTNAVVDTAFLVEEHWDKADKYTTLEQKVDSLGRSILSGNDLDNYFYVDINTAGYYESTVKVVSTSLNRILNRWEPWNPTIEVKMRKIKNPVPMVCKNVNWKFKIPKYNTPIGLDLERGDWVQPYGDGIVCDMLIEIIPLNPTEKGSQCRITFPNQLDGIQEYEFEWKSSSFKWPYLAPTTGYSNVLEKFYVLNLPKVAGAPKHTLKKEANYIIRTRTKVDNEGQIISACYGYFEGEIMFLPKGEFSFSYHFNPVPNERSLEWNGVNLLKKK